MSGANVRRWIIALLSTLWLGAGWAQPLEPPVVQQPDRAVGYFIGDVLVQRIEHWPDDGTLAANGLNEPQRVSAYLLRTPVVQPGGDTLEIRYQVINAPTETVTTYIPALTISREAGPDIAIAEWSFSISPLLEKSDQAVQASQLKADLAALEAVPPRSDRPLKISAATLLCALSLWALWWLYRHFRDQHVLPFARARKLIRRGRQPQSEHWVALHRAFNATAGKSINRSTIDDLVDTAPWLAPSRAAIDEFYLQSAERFYRPSGQPPPFDIAQLCDQLYRCERAHAGSRR